MGVPGSVFERAVPVITFRVEDDPKGFERARRITKGYESVERDAEKRRRSSAAKRSRGKRKK